MAENSDTQSSTTQISTENPTGQVPSFHGFPCSADGNIKMFPVMYPVLVPGLIANPNHEQRNRGAGIYAVPVLPFTGSVAGIPSNTLIPLTYSIPTRPSTSDAGAGGGEQNQLGQQQQQIAPQRQIVVRRFQIAFQVDLLLILKLAAVIFLFNQDGSRQRLALLVFLASLVYLYQTGALAPFVRWVSQAMHRAAAPPRPPRLVARAEANVQPEDENVAAAEGLGAENDNRTQDDANGVAENDGAGEAGANGGNGWWRMVKEVQMIVFGFITSLLPGFHNVDHA
ncbi:hypothetical protein Nepgr_004985 [Nepenthes gracilis]|uniref:Transmembrane protein n=1 Tax=Nepenthes gracilis TaxID=150966 RepID=A0AAD3S2G3_NEPGR|nr:hypothetical protein Nepgr_004985 [Nepenthes gracilis]